MVLSGPADVAAQLPSQPRRARRTSTPTTQRGEKPWAHDVGKEQPSVAAEYIEPESGRVCKVLVDGTLILVPGWEKPHSIVGQTITIPTLCSVTPFLTQASDAGAHTSNSQASDQARHTYEEGEPVHQNERHGSSQHVPELPPRARSAPPRVSVLAPAAAAHAAASPGPDSARVRRAGAEHVAPPSSTEEQKPTRKALGGNVKSEAKKGTADGSPACEANLNDQQAGELLLNFANSAAISSGARGGAPTQSSPPQQRSTSLDQDATATGALHSKQEDGVHAGGAAVGASGGEAGGVPTAGLSPAAAEATGADKLRVYLESRATVPRAAAAATGGAVAGSLPRVNPHLGTASQFAAGVTDGPKRPSDAAAAAQSQLQLQAVTGPAAVPAADTAGVVASMVGAPAADKVRDVAADMLVCSLITTIAAQAPHAELPDDEAVMECLIGFANACLEGHNAPTGPELQAALARCKKRARASLAPHEILTAGAAARAAAVISPAMAAAGKKQAVALPALAKGPPPAASAALGTSAAPAAVAAAAAAAASAGIGTPFSLPGGAPNPAMRPKRPATPISHMQAPAKAPCTNLQPKQQLQGVRRLSQAGEQVASRENDMLTALRAAFHQNPTGVARLLLQSVEKPGGQVEAERVAAQPPTSLPVQASSTPPQPVDVTDVRRAVLQQMLQANPQLVAQLQEQQGMEAVRAALQARSTPVTQPQPPQPQQPADFIPVLCDLQQSGASDQTVLHVLQTLMQQSALTQPPAAPAGVSAPMLQASAGAPATGEATALPPTANVLAAALANRAQQGSAQLNITRVEDLAALSRLQQQQQQQQVARPVQARLPAARPSGGAGVVTSGPLLQSLDHMMRSQAAGAKAQQSSQGPAGTIGQLIQGVDGNTQAQLVQILSGLESFNRVQNPRSSAPPVPNLNPPSTTN